MSKNMFAMKASRSNGSAHTQTHTHLRTCMASTDLTAPCSPGKDHRHKTFPSLLC